MTTGAMAADALTRARVGQSVMNYATIFEGFTALGIPADDIKPRENIFTYHAWRAAGRQVRKGEHGVRVLTFVTMQSRSNQDDPTAPLASFRRPKTTTVFHVSQTDPITGGV